MVVTYDDGHIEPEIMEALGESRSVVRDATNARWKLTGQKIYRRDVGQRR
jgi:hypothetical protein